MTMTVREAIRALERITNKDNPVVVCCPPVKILELSKTAPTGPILDIDTIDDGEDMAIINGTLSQ